MDKFTNRFNQTFGIDTSVQPRQQPMQPRSKVLGKNPRDAMTKAASRRRQQELEEQQELEAFARTNNAAADNESKP